MIKVGDKVVIRAGLTVHSCVGSKKRAKPSVVTVRELTQKMTGVVTIAWKSHGRRATCSAKL